MEKRTKYILIGVGSLLALTGIYFGVRKLMIISNYLKVVTEQNALDIINQEASNIDESEIDYNELGVNQNEDNPTGVMLGNESIETIACIINGELLKWDDSKEMFISENSNVSYDINNENYCTNGVCSRLVSDSSKIVYGKVDENDKFTYN